MKKYIQYIPLTAFAAAIMLGGSLSAADKAPKGASMRDQQRQSQLPAHTVDKNANVSMPDQANSRPMTASEVLGMNINTAANEKIGEIDEIFINSGTGEVLAMVVSTGGFLGIGQHQAVISPEDLRFNADGTLMQTDISKDQIRSAPRYQKGETAGLDRVRPLGKTAADWDVRKDRQARSETGPTAGLGQTPYNRPAAGGERTERVNQPESRQTAANRPTIGEDRADRANRLENVQPHGRKLAVSELIGMSVQNRQGEAVGKVNEVFLDLEKREVVGVVVSTGGFLGIGDRKTLFGMREMSFDPTNEKVLLDYNRDQIREFPEYKVNEQSVFTALRERMDRLAPHASSYNARTPVDGGLAVKSGDDARTEARNVGSSTLGRSSEKAVLGQGNGSDEIAMTASIRTAIRENAALSNRANNVTIITNEGKVVLRGEVDSASEKTTVEGIAQTKAGRQNVTSELIVHAR